MIVMVGRSQQLPGATHRRSPWVEGHKYRLHSGMAAESRNVIDIGTAVAGTMMTVAAVMIAAIAVVAAVVVTALAILAFAVVVTFHHRRRRLGRAVERRRNPSVEMAMA